MDPKTVRDSLLTHNVGRVFKAQFFDLYVAYAKENDTKVPRYEAFREQEEADANFMFDLQRCTARMSWGQCSKLVAAACDVPVPTKDWTEAFHFVCILLASALGAEDYMLKKKGAATKIEVLDRDALDEWPIPAITRRSKNTEENEQVTIKAKNTALKAKSRDVADTEEEEEEEEDESPAVTSKPSKKVKKEKKEKKDTEPKNAVSSGGILKKLKDREKGGSKTKLLNLIPKKGISLKDLTAAASEVGLPSKKIAGFVSGLQKNGYISK